MSSAYRPATTAYEKDKKEGHSTPSHTTGCF